MDLEIVQKGVKADRWAGFLMFLFDDEETGFFQKIRFFASPHRFDTEVE